MYTMFMLYFCILDVYYTLGRMTVNKLELELEPEVVRPKGSAVEGRRDGDDGVDGGQRGQEEDDQQHGHVEVVGARRLEDALLRRIAAHDRPALQVHGHVEAQHVERRQARRVERTHPGRRGWGRRRRKGKKEGRRKKGVR